MKKTAEKKTVREVAKDVIVKETEQQKKRFKVKTGIKGGMRA